MRFQNYSRIWQIVRTGFVGIGRLRAHKAAMDVFVKWKPVGLKDGKY